MADSYVDQGAYASNLGATPTWGEPQEGDGTATAASTSASVGSILFNAVPTTGNFVICGVTFTSPAGVLSAANADAAANALASLINASTTTVGSAVAYGTPQLRNLVFARGPSGGAASGTCEIMMRVGSDTLNHATNSNVAMSHTFNGTAPTVTQFAGGTGGCWGWFLSDVALGVSSSIAVQTYGLFAAAPMVLPATPGEFDSIIVRTGRNLTIAVGGFAPQSTRISTVTYLMDDGTSWSGDPTSGVFTINSTFSNSGFRCNGTVNNFYTRIKSRRLGGLLLNIAQTNSSANVLCDIFGMGASGNSGGVHLERISIVEVSNASTTSMASPRFLFQFGSLRSDWSMVGCLWDCSAVSRVALPRAFISLALSSNSGGNITFLGNDIRFTLTGSGGAALVNPLVYLNASTTRLFNLIFRGNKVSIGQPGVDFPALQLGAAARAGFTAVLENNNGLGLPSGAVGLSGASGTEASEDSVLILDNLNVGGDVKYEVRRGYFEFVNGQPVLSALSPTGTLWSWLCFWSQASEAISETRRLSCPVIRVQNRLGTGARTWKIETFLDAIAESNLPSGAEIEVEYVTTGNEVVFERVPIALVSSSAAWTNTSSYPSHVKYSISGTTASPVLADSMIQIRIAFVRPASVGTASTFFFDPEPVLT